MTQRLSMLVFFLAGCGARGGVCGDGGEYYEDATGRYCAYVVIIGGFECPPELPNFHEFGDTTVCADHPIPEHGPVPGPLCVDLGPACPQPLSDPDAGTPRDAGTDGGVECDPVAQTGCGAGEKCTWVAGLAGFPAGDTRCAPDGAIPEWGACAVSAGGVADDCAAGWLCVDGADVDMPRCIAACSMSSTVPPNFCHTEPDVFDDRPGVGHRIYAPCTPSLHDCPPGEGCYVCVAGELFADTAACHQVEPGAGAIGAPCARQRDCDRYHACISGTCERLCLDVAGNPSNPDVCPVGTTCTTVTAFPGFILYDQLDVCLP